MNHVQSQQGVTLVELMVGLTIGLVLSLAASSIYLATTETSRATKAHGDINETGKLALDMVGREIEKAGFYPAQYPTDAATDKVNGQYTNTKAPGPTSIYNAGLYGCDGAHYDASVGGACEATTAGKPDGIIINYFATEEFGASSYLGNSNDCNRKPASGDAANAARVTAKLPIFVSNRFGLVDSNYTDPDGNALKAHSLACHGNGAEANTTLQPLLMGVEDLVFRYGVYAAGGTDTTVQSPDQFLTAAQVNALTSISGLSPWQRVSAVKVCMLVRSLQNARTEDATRTYVDCRGNSKTQPVTDHTVYKRFERVYAVRNNLTGTL